MFEQPLYEFEPVAAPREDGDLFQHYEIKSWDWSARLYKILAISAVANIVAALVFAQTSLLTMKGCESPLVGSVCQVLDTVYVGSLLFGTDREYVDVAYDKIDLGDSEITYIDASLITPPLTYPAGYFQIANPEMALLEKSLDPGQLFTHGIPGIPDGVPITPSTGGNLFDTEPNIPKSNPNVIEGDLPGSTGNYFMPSPGSTYKPYKPKRPKIKNPPLGEDDTIPGIPNSNTVAEIESPSPSASPTPPAVDPTGPVDANDINTRPFKDLAKEVNDLLDKKQIDLQAPIKILATAKLAKDGKIVKDSFKVTNAASSDEQLVKVAARAVAAFGESNLLSYLKDLTGKNLTFLVQQDPTNVAAAVKSEVESDARAKSIASALNIIITVARQNKEEGIKKLEAENNPEKAEALQHLKDDFELLKNTQVTTNGKEFIVGFSAPKDSVQQMILRMLAGQKAVSKPTEASAATTPVDKSTKN